MIAPLHNHSQFSALDGLSTPEEIAARCVEIDVTACGLTDHGVVTGHLDFSKALTKAGVKPIFGCELYHGVIAGNEVGRGRDQAHLIALAETDEGLCNLWRLVNATAAREKFHQVGRVDWDDLEKYKEGLIVTSACALGLVSKQAVQGEYDHLNRYLDIFKDNFFIEISTYPISEEFNDEGEEALNQGIINEALIAIAKERGIPLVYANDAHYAFPHQYHQHDLYLAAQTKQNVYTDPQDRKMWHPPEALSIMSEETVREALSYLPGAIVDEALGNSVAIAERVNASLPEVSRHLPKFVPGDCPWLEKTTKNAEELFIDLVEAGIYERYGNEPSEEVWERAVYEMETLIKDGIHHYFLMGWDEIQFARSNDIEIGPGRGSSAGCIVAYALGITDVDPLHYGLIFERFWNSGRASGFPDIDTDFTVDGRPRVREYLIERWGKKNVCSIGTVRRMKPKAVVDQFYKWFGLEMKEAEEVKKILDGVPDLEIHGPDQIGWSEELEPGKVIYVEDHVGDELFEWIGAVQDIDVINARQDFINMCKSLCSRVEGYGIHASGIVIADIPLDDYAPAYLRGGKKEGIPATMFPMDEIEKLGLNKLDVLGLKTLDTLAIWKAMMEKQGAEITWSGLDREQHPAEMWRLLADGICAGIFQIEQGYAKRLCERMQPKSVEDLAVIVALNRPGPIGMRIPDHYIARRQGQEEVSYPHKILSTILEPTYGLFVYQEQVIAYYNALGYTLQESDAVRSILGKKKPEALQALYEGSNEWEGRGYMRMADIAGVEKKAAQEIWDGLERFASYSFNKSHAVAYGILSFRTTFAKYYGPAEFLASCTQVVTDDKRVKMLPRYVSEARNYFGRKVYPPNIAISEAMCEAVDGDIYFGFSDVKGVGLDSAKTLVRLRTDGYDVSSPETMLNEIEVANTEFLALKKIGEVEGKSPKQSLQVNKIQAVLDAGAWDELGERDGLKLSEIQGFEAEKLGVILTDLTDEILARNKDALGECDSLSQVLIPFAVKASAIEGVVPDSFYYRICGIVSEVKKTTVKATGAPMAIVTVEGEGKEVTFAVFSHRWARDKSLFRVRNVGIFRIRHTGPSETRNQEGYSFEEGWLLK